MRGERFVKERILRPVLEGIIRVLERPAYEGAVIRCVDGFLEGPQAVSLKDVNRRVAEVAGRNGYDPNQFEKDVRDRIAVVAARITQREIHK